MRTVWCPDRPGRHSPPQSPSFGRFPGDPRALLRPPALGLPACDSRHLPSCSQPLHLEAGFRGRRTFFSTWRHLRIAFGTSGSDVTPSLQHPRRTGGDSPSGGGCRGAPSLTAATAAPEHPAPGSGEGAGEAPGAPAPPPTPRRRGDSPAAFQGASLSSPPPTRTPAPPGAPPPPRALPAGAGSSPAPLLLPSSEPRTCPAPRGSPVSAAPRGRAHGGGSTWPRRRVNFSRPRARRAGPAPPRVPPPPGLAESAEDLRRPARAHLLLPDPLAGGPGRAPRRSRGRSPAAKPRAVWKGPRCPETPSSGPPRGRCPERVPVPAGREARA